MVRDLARCASTAKLRVAATDSVTKFFWGGCPRESPPPSKSIPFEAKPVRVGFIAFTAILKHTSSVVRCSTPIQKKDISKGRKEGRKDRKEVKEGREKHK